jgi:long-chain acyl-CoA synthetase
MTDNDTIPKLLYSCYKKYGDKKVAMRKKNFGIWQEYTWKDCYDHVKYFSLGLISLGLKRGDRVSIVGDNDPEWFWGEYAVQAIGGVAVGLYVDSIPSEIRYIVNHSDTRFILAKDEEQLDKILSLKEELPQIAKVIYWEDKGMWKYEEPLLMYWREVEEVGKEYDEAHPGFFEEQIEKVQPNDYAIFSYTSGTTGEPKGVIHTHRTALTCSRNQLELFPWTEEDDYLSYLPPAWIGEQFLGIVGGLLAVPRINFPEELDTVTENIREIAPRVLLFNPRLWESMAATVQAKMLDAASINRFIYNLALKVGYKVIDYQVERKKIPLVWKCVSRLADWMVFRHLRDRLGLSKIRFAVTGGGPLSPDCFRFFRAMGIPMVQEFGFSEILPVTGHANDQWDVDSIGQEAKGVQIKIGDDNEILVRSEGLCLGYYKNPEETRAKIVDGWFHTGDAGYMDKERKLIYWDRVKDLIELASGAKFPPQYIEGKLKFSPYIRDCIVLGGKEREFVAAMIAMDFDISGRWAETHRLPYTTFTDLSQKEEIIDLIKKDIKKVNQTLPEEQRVKKFISMHKEFDPDEAELTRTRKLRRSFMEERYKGIIEAIYSGQDVYSIESALVYRDGRTGVVKAEIKINSLE